MSMIYANNSDTFQPAFHRDFRPDKMKKHDRHTCVEKLKLIIPDIIPRNKHHLGCDQESVD